MKKTSILLLFLVNFWCSAASIPQNPAAASRQLISISSPDWDSVNAQMQRFERNSTQDSWKTVGKPVPVVIGRHGMGWDLRFKNIQDKAPVKHEGDGRTPVGVYAIGPAFGFNKNSTDKMDYFPLTDTSVCVDDIQSLYYNQLIDSLNVAQKDWNSGEAMRQIPQYQYGAVIQYNTAPVKPGAGSCIFMHIWKNPNSGTAGCIAMALSDLQTSLGWLDSQKNPVIAIFPKELSHEFSSII